VVGQPARIPFDIPSVAVDGRQCAVITRDVLKLPFCVLTEFKLSRSSKRDRMLVVAPLSGHFPVLLRDVVLGLLPHWRVYLTDWVNARHVPPSRGRFGLDDNIGYIVKMMQWLGPRVDLMALCQSAVPSLAASAIVSQQGAAPRTLVLIAGPVDPLANPTPVVRSLRDRSLQWFSDNMVADVPALYPGAGRLVHRASFHLMGLMTYLARHLCQHRELRSKLLDDDGAEPARFPFWKLYGSVMDLSAEFFLENIQAVFHDRAICHGALSWRSTAVDLGAISDTALMTVEGEHDDIAAPGQTRAAHRLCPRIADDMRSHLVVRGSGHFSLFHGDRWRDTVLPEIREFLGRVGHPRPI
jgi:poly(3-hydroxybutyrate) depolymerase